MLKACTAQQMRLTDKAATEMGAIPSLILMENAALQTIEVLKERFADIEKRRILIFCGKGNNGGDGFTAARHLYNIGSDVCVILTGGDSFAGDCLTNYEIIKKMGVPIMPLPDEDILKYMIKGADIVIDAIYGTGIRGEIYGAGLEAIRCINQYARYVLSVDIPSGVNADSGEICPTAVKADDTVTFAAYKIGMLAYPGADYCGRITVKPISIPQYVIDAQNIGINVPQTEDIAKMLPKRQNNSQKGDYGKVLICAGSRGMTGAAAMAANACIKSGAGLVTLAVPESLNPILEEKTTEAMTLPLREKNGRLSVSAADELLKKMEKSDILLFGPGLGRDEETVDILRELLSKSQIPIIIDADGLYALSRDIDMLRDCGCNLILTPHVMELSRLCGYDVNYIEENRYAVSAEFAQEYGVTLILKGHYTIVTAPDGTQYTNTTGNHGMAVGGSGDVLSGICAAFAAVNQNEPEAAAAAVYVHGAAGDITAECIGEDGVTPTAMTENIPYAIRLLRQKLQIEKG